MRLTCICLGRRLVERRRNRQPGEPTLAVESNRYFASQELIHLLFRGKPVFQLVTWREASPGGANVGGVAN